jgi:hypothetical protein
MHSNNSISVHAEKRALTSQSCLQARQHAGQMLLKTLASGLIPSGMLSQCGIGFTSEQVM